MGTFVLIPSRPRPEEEGAEGMGDLRCMAVAGRSAALGLSL